MYTEKVIIKKKYYVDSKILEEEILKSKQNDQLTNDAVKIINLMIKNISLKFSYKYENDRIECESAALENVVYAWRNYDPNKSNNAFSYFTQVIKTGFAKGFNILYPTKNGTKINIDFF
jgi:hypothetical protein